MTIKEIPADPQFLSYSQSRLSSEALDFLASKCEHLSPEDVSRLSNEKIACAVSPNRFANFVTLENVPLGRFATWLLCHEEKRNKGEGVFIPGLLREHRTDRCVHSAYALCFDLDGTLNWKRLRKLCKRFGFMVIVYTTYSHLADGKTEKYRVVVFLEQPVSISEVAQDGYRALYRAIGELLFDGAIFDQSCCNPSHPFFLATHPPGEADKHFSVLFAGPLFDPGPVWKKLKAQVARDRLVRQKLAEERRLHRQKRSASEAHGKINACLDCIPADCPYDEWFKVLCAIMHETECSEGGRQLAHDWSALSPEQYDHEELEQRLDSIESAQHAKPATMGTLVWLARKYVPAFQLPSAPTRAVSRPVNISPLW